MSLVLAPPPQSDQYDLNVACSDEFQAIVEHLKDLAETYNFPESRYQENHVQKFYGLVKTWRNDLKRASSITQAALHPSYQQIIGMGKEILPLILKELEAAPLYWFWAVKAITQTDPVSPQHKGEIQEMKDAWLRWARDQGYEW